MKLGKIIKKYRDDHSLTMRDFEKKSGLSRSYISLLEKGAKIAPTIPTIRKVAKGMSISFDDLMAVLDENQEININDIENNFDKVLTLIETLDKSELKIVYDTIGKIIRPSRKDMITWLNDNVRYASSGGVNYEYMGDEELRGFYEEMRRETD